MIVVKTGGDLLREADDHDQREVALQHGLAARIDVPGQAIDGRAHRRDDPGMIVRHDVQDVCVLEARLHVGDPSTPGTESYPCEGRG